MKIDTNDIRKRLSNNTAIDAKEIQALCDEVERLKSKQKSIDGVCEESKYEVVREALGNVTKTFEKRGWTEESKRLHSDICCDIMNSKH